MAQEDHPKRQQLAFDMSPASSKLLSELIDAVRSAGHARPSQKTLVQALLETAPRDGQQLEMKVLVPYRKAHPEEE
jgi:hypothetical protein